MTKKKKATTGFKITASLFGAAFLGLALLAVFGERVTEWDNARYRIYPGANVARIRASLLKQSGASTQIEATNDTLLEVHNRVSINGAGKENDYDALIWLSPQPTGVRATVSTKDADPRFAPGIATSWLDNIGSHLAQ